MIRGTVSFILMLLCWPIWAQTVQNPLLYRISTSHGESYILGTIHAFVHLEDFQFDVKSLVERTDFFMPEMDVAQEQLEILKKDGSAAIRMVVAKIPASTKRVDAWTAGKLVEFGFPADIAGQLKDNDCTQLPLLIEFENGLPLDAQVMQAAHLSQRRIVNLDTKELREKALALIKWCDFHQMFTATEPKEFAKGLRKYIEDDARFYRAGVEPSGDEDPSTVLRNEAWIPEIENQLKTGSVFVSVGYGHLFGVHGILQLLRNNGYAISRVSSQK